MTEALKQLSDRPSDVVLIAAVRRGETSAFGVLYSRHLAAAQRAASCLVRTAVEREDLVAEAFTRVLQSLRAGRGPVEGFRPYLLVTMRHLAMNTAHRTPATTLLGDVPEDYLGAAADDDPVVDQLVGSEAASAFAGLPERWRVVLWHTEIEGESPAAVAPLLGMTPNGVAALAYRAREGLRLAYLQQHLPCVQRRECRDVTAKLAGWVRRSISAPQRRKVATHLARCPHCRDLANSLQQLNGELRAILAPVVLGAGFAAAYLKVSAVSTASSGLTTTVSWLSTAKASIAAVAGQTGAAAAIAAVTAVTVVASDPTLVTGEHGGPITAGGPSATAPRADHAQPSPSAPQAGQPRPHSTPTPAVPTRPEPTPANPEKATKPARDQQPAEVNPPQQPQPPLPAVARGGPANNPTGHTVTGSTRGRHAGPPHPPTAQAPRQPPIQPTPGNTQPGRHTKR